MRIIDLFANPLAYALYLIEGKTPPLPFEKVREDLLGYFEQSEELAKQNGVAENDYINAKFAVCAWVDEALLTSNWPDREQWKNIQLQRGYFNTNNAGVEFFQRLEKLGSEDKSVREVYAICLALGFRGKYFLPDNESERDGITKELLSRVKSGRFAEYTPETDHLFPSAYRPDPGAPGRRWNVWRFDWYTVLIPVAALIIVGQIYWLYHNDLNITLLNFFGSLN
ncbi:DotU family type IV/VI secretion system protein [Desulfovibrio inopinatus]|uniref:DotU family type IV/VI secretion system protein n=1 Tax=Desulfovibrio inopinatus TaxID=102109 RepID=UPI00040A2E3E|nr:DotU family type IV/VI secretion system protein [Desulfovibrio inopinatus]